jgi:hypothetical protein
MEPNEGIVAPTVLRGSVSDLANLRKIDDRAVTTLMAIVQTQLGRFCQRQT